jgi:HAD superfamily hydrolase (TIGR01509 family)
MLEQHERVALEESARRPLFEILGRRLLSFELGLRKPDLAIYQAFADRLPYNPDRVLFLDDPAVNVDAVRSSSDSGESTDSGVSRPTIDP